MNDQLYVLKLEMGKWYIGRSCNVERRFQQHCDGIGSKWTQLHKPISIEITRPLVSDDDEDKTTREYMMKYGIYNVRGGKYCAVEFKQWHMNEIQKGILYDKCIERMNYIKKFPEKLWSDMRSGRWIDTLLSSW